MQKYNTLVEKGKKVHSIYSEIAGRENDMTKNHDGAFVFKLDDMKMLDRFLILGSDKPTYYASAKQTTKLNAENIRQLIVKNPQAVVDRIVEVSDAGRAPNNDPALFALAMVAGLADDAGKRYALDNLSKVARIGTHLFHFIEYVQAFRGWGRGLRNGLANWYLEKGIDKLAYQVVKYQGRDGWTHRDVLRKSHVKVTEDNEAHDFNTILAWVTHGVGGERRLEDGTIEKTFPYTIDDVSGIRIIHAFEQAKKATDESEIVKLIEEYNLPREAIPTNFMGRAVYEALMPKMGLTALIRNLGNLSKVGILETGNFDEINLVADKITNPEALKKARVHPMAVLIALSTYRTGHGLRGSSTWNVVQRIVDALDDSFYAAFGSVESTGKKILVGLDVSGSMGMYHIQNTQLKAREAAAAMLMVMARTEKNYAVKGFSSNLVDIAISPKMRLDDVIRVTSSIRFDWTNVSLPFHWAIEANKDFDAVIIYTDNETNHGEHPAQVMERYRQKVGHDVKLIVVGMTATDFTVADPKDTSSLDVVGFDANAPTIMSDFIADKF